MLDHNWHTVHNCNPFIYTVTMVTSVCVCLCVYVIMYVSVYACVYVRVRVCACE